MTSFTYWLCRIIATRESDSGMYLCMAKNSLGSILTTTQLTVRGIYSVLRHRNNKQTDTYRINLLLSMTNIYKFRHSLPLPHRDSNPDPPAFWSETISESTIHTSLEVQRLSEHSRILSVLYAKCMRSSLTYWNDPRMGPYMGGIINLKFVLGGTWHICPRIELFWITVIAIGMILGGGSSPAGRRILSPLGCVTVSPCNEGSSPSATMVLLLHTARSWASSTMSRGFSRLYLMVSIHLFFFLLLCCPYMCIQRGKRHNPENIFTGFLLSNA